MRGFGLQARRLRGGGYLDLVNALPVMRDETLGEDWCVLGHSDELRDRSFVELREYIRDEEEEKQKRHQKMRQRMLMWAEAEQLAFGAGVAPIEIHLPAPSTRRSCQGTAAISCSQAESQ